MKPYRHLFLAIVLVLAGIAPAGTSVAQEEDDDASLIEAVEVGPLEFAYNAIRGKAGSVAIGFNERFREPPDVDDQAADLRSFVNDHDAELVDHGNEVLDEYDVTVRNTTYVLEVTVVDDKDDPDEESTFYVIGEANGSEITSLQAATSTNKTVDRESTLSAHQAKALNEDLEDYYDDYVDDGEIPSIGHYIRVGSKYTSISEIRERT